MAGPTRTLPARPNVVWRLFVLDQLAETMRRRLAMFVLRAKVTIEDTRERYALLGLAGPHTADIAHDALGITVSPLAAVSFNGDAAAFTLPDGFAPPLRTFGHKSSLLKSGRKGGF